MTEELKGALEKLTLRVEQLEKGYSSLLLLVLVAVVTLLLLLLLLLLWLY